MVEKQEGAAVRLTDKLVKGATPANKDYILWDSLRKGLGLRVFPSGRKSY